MNIQEAIRSGRPFRRAGWVDGNIFVICPPHDIVLALESDPRESIDLDVQDILADDWYVRQDVRRCADSPDQVFQQQGQSHRRESAA